MSGIRAGLVLVASVVTSLCLALAIGAAAQDEPAAEPAIGVEWDYRPAELADLVAQTPAIVVAEVGAVRDGEPFVGEPADDEGGPISFPTQQVDVRVVRSLDGQAPGNFTLFKIGSAEEYPEGDPSYQVGERYLLFVRPRLGEDGGPHPDGTWLPVAPDGRLERLPSGELDAVIEGEVAKELDGATVGEADQAIEAAEAGGQ